MGHRSAAPKDGYSHAARRGPLLGRPRSGDRPARDWVRSVSSGVARQAARSNPSRRCIGGAQLGRSLELMATAGAPDDLVDEPCLRVEEL